jgi:hypothetical protein
MEKSSVGIEVSIDRLREEKVIIFTKLKYIILII